MKCQVCGFGGLRFLYVVTIAVTGDSLTLCYGHAAGFLRVIDPDADVAVSTVEVG